MTGNGSRGNRFNDDSSDLDIKNTEKVNNRNKRNVQRPRSIYSSISSYEEEGTTQRKCSLPCQKKTILIGAFAILQVAAFIGIGIFFGEQQREIDKHESLVGYFVFNM